MAKHFHRKYFNRLLLLGLAASALGLLEIEAMAQSRIGEAAAIRNQVLRVSAGRNIGLTTGGSVFRNETVRTGRDSSAKLVFLDQTNLAIGPVSSVKLDRFVFAGTGSSQALSVNLTRGVFRFTTGVLDKRAYKINTPVATIGVRGTVLDISALSAVALITLKDNGAALICTRARRPKCLELTNLGDSVRVTRTSIVRVRNPSQRYTFQSNCNDNPGICQVTRLASTTAPTAGSVRLADLNGNILVNRGGGFSPAAGTESLSTGNRVVANPNSAVTVIYPDGCRVRVNAGTVHTISASPPCRSSLGIDGSAGTYVLGGLGAILVGVGIYVLVDDDDDKRDDHSDASP